MLAGEPGIGKTRTVQELAAVAEERGARVLVGHCYEEGSLSLPYLAFVEAMRSYVLEREVESLEEDLGSGATDVARIVPEVRERLKVEPGPSSDPDQDRYRLLQAVVSFLRSASTAQPLLIVLEDLHDAESGTLDMLGHVARNLSGSRFLVVGTYRDVEVDRSHPLSGALAELRRLPDFSRVLLRGLSADEVQRMLSVISDREIPWGLAEALHRQTEGNPLFVQEVVRYLVEEGLIARGQSRPASDVALAMSIPEGLRDVIGKRLSRLSDECNRVLRVAAVMGREFNMDVLGHVAEVSEEELFVALEEAQGAAVIEERSSVGGVVTFRFAHAFFRQTLYEETFAPRRIRLHRQVGEALEEVYSARLAEHASEMAEHFSNSSDDIGLGKALKYGEMAAERAMSVYAYGEAARLLEQALDVQEVLDPDDRAMRCDLLLSLGGALLPAGETRRVMDAVAPEAFTLAEAVSERARASRACRLALDAIFRYGGTTMAGTPEYLQWAQRAGRYADPGTTDRVYADIRLIGVRVHEGKLTEARALALRTMELARNLEDPEAIYRVARELVVAPLSPPRHEEEVLQLVTEMSSYDQAGVTAQTLGSWLGWAGSVLMDWGDRSGAEAMWDQFTRLAQRTDVAGTQIFSVQYRRRLAYLDGRLNEAVSGADEIVRTAEEMGAPVMGRGAAAWSRLRPLLQIGRGEEALAGLAEWADLEGAETLEAIEVLSVLVRAHMGQAAEARKALPRLLAEPRLGFDDENLGTFVLIALLEIAILVSDQELCSILAERLDPAANLSTTLVADTCPPDIWARRPRCWASPTRPGSTTSRRWRRQTRYASVPR